MMLTAEAFIDAPARVDSWLAMYIVMQISGKENTYFNVFSRLSSRC
jgi:hypothetical protein